jgi:TIR domain
MEVFVSHATEDRSLAARFAGLLHEGLGLAGSDVFLSSRAGDIPNGKYFTEHILTTLSRADLVVALLSRVYMTRPFCQNEAGAALVGQINGDKELRAFVLPPFRFDEMAGALVGVQSGSIVDASDLDVFRTSILPRLTSAPHESAWRVHRDAFLHDAVLEVAQLRAEDYLSRIEIRDVHIERSAAAHIKFKSKFSVGEDTACWARVRQGSAALSGF